jgi:hypothetical protein
MEQDNRPTDTYLCYELAIKALRLRAIVSLDAIPNENEDIDLLLLLLIGDRNDDRTAFP